MRLQVFDSSGHLVIDLGEQLVAGAPADLAFSSRPFVADGQALLTITAPGSSLWFAWNGTGSEGQLLPPGVYHVKAMWSEPGKAVQETRISQVSVMPSQDSTLKSLVMAPNPAGRGDEQVRLFWKPSARAATLKARIYNLGGELVYGVDVDAVRAYLEWNLSASKGDRVANGTYVWVLELYDRDQRLIERGTRKLAVLRR